MFWFHVASWEVGILVPVVVTPKVSGATPTVSSSLMGSLTKGYPLLQKVCGNSAESSRKFGKKIVLLRQERVRKFCGKLRKFGGNLRNIFCNDPFPNDPIRNYWDKGIKSGDFPESQAQKAPLSNVYRNHRKRGTASSRSRMCVKRTAVFGALFKGLCLQYIYISKKGIWYVSKRAWIHVWYVSKPVPPVTVPPLWLFQI